MTRLRLGGVLVGAALFGPSLCWSPTPCWAAPPETAVSTTAAPTSVAPAVSTSATPTAAAPTSVATAGAAAPMSTAAPVVDERSPTQVCVESHGASQEARADKRFLDAKQNLLECSKAVCPGLIRGDCARWFDEMEALIPSIAVVVRRSGIDVDGAEILVDGATVSAGREFDVDPGSHQIVVRMPGEEARTRTIQVSPGEQHRLVTIELPALASDRDIDVAPRAAVPMHRPVPTITWILGGATIAFGVTGGVFGALALSERDSLTRPVADGGCSPNCSNDRVAAMNTDALVADIAFALTAASAAGAVLTYLFRPEVPLEEAKLSRGIDGDERPHAEPSALSRFHWSVSPVGAFVGGAF